MLNTEFDNRFWIEEEIYKNDRAWIYRGVDKQSGAAVAIKVLRPWTAASEKLESRFAQEFQLLRHLEHPNIVRVIQTGLTPNRFHYFAMELLTGQTLAQRLREQGRFPAGRVADILDQLADAIDTAHARNIVHRDLTPSNVMLHAPANGGPETVKILDFGLAKIISEEAPSQGAVLTAAGVSVGTPAYMSPEQAMGQPVDKSSDIYSLGVTLFNLLTGVVPFDKSSEYATMVAHVSEPVPWFSERGAANVAPPGVEAVVRAAMSKDPKDRPGSARELARLFRQALEHPDRIPEAVRAASIKPAAVPGAAIPGAAVPGAAIPGAAKEPEPRESAARGGIPMPMIFGIAGLVVFIAIIMYVIK